MTVQLPGPDGDAEHARRNVEALDLEKLRHSRSDTHHFWRLVDGILEEEGLGYGSRPEGRRNAERHKRDALRG